MEIRCKRQLNVEMVWRHKKLCIEFDHGVIESMYRACQEQDIIVLRQEKMKSIPVKLKDGILVEDKDVTSDKLWVIKQLKVGDPIYIRSKYYMGLGIEKKDKWHRAYVRKPMLSTVLRVLFSDRNGTPVYIAVHDSDIVRGDVDITKCEEVSSLTEEEVKISTTEAIVVHDALIDHEAMKEIFNNQQGETNG